MTTAIEPPAPTCVLREARGLAELPRLLLRLPRLAWLPRGRGQAVLVLPGYGVGDAATAVLRGYLRFIGYAASGWELGTNTGDVPSLLPRVLQRLEAVALASGGPVHLVGWSLGGYLAREAARERPNRVARVITLGSPVVGGPKYTSVAGLYRRRGADLDAIEAQVAERSRVPLRVPVTAIYSRSDAVVAWRACIDPHSPCVEHVEVETSHVGLGFAPEVYEIIARRLAAPLAGAVSDAHAPSAPAPR